MTDRQESNELMYIRCAYCGEWIDVKPGKMNEITHTICPACQERVTSQHAQKRGPARPPPKR